MNSENQPQEPQLLDHEYDGIRELDNKLPRWWVWLFYGSIVFAAVYLLYYHVFAVGDLSAAEYEKEKKAGEALKTAAMSSFEAGFATLQPSKEPALLDAGRQTFLRLCAP